MKINHIKNVTRAINLTWTCDKNYLLIKISTALFNIVLSFFSLNLAKILIDLLTSDIILCRDAIICIFVKLIIDLTLLIFNLFQNKYYPVIETKLSYQIQEQLIRTVTKVEYAKFDNSEFYDVMEYALKETQGLTKSIDSFITIFSGVINFFTAVVLCIKYDYTLPILLIVGILPYYFIKRKLNRFVFDTSKEISSLGRKTSAIRHLLTSKHYAHEVRSFELFDFLIGKYRIFVKDIIRTKTNSSKTKNNYSFALELFNLLIGAIASIRLIILLSIKIITFGEYSLVQSYVIKIQTSLNTIINCVLNIEDHNLYLDNLFNFVDQSNCLLSDKKVLKLPPKSAHKIEFRNVSFNYPNHQQLILENVSFTIESGESVLLIGENGAGKTTLLLLLNAFYENYKGEIFIDDVNIKRLDSDSIRREISMMFQGGALLPLTLYDNISCGKKIDGRFSDYPWFETLISKYPRKLDTHLLTYMYPDGISPSGGETQRIKLMRAIKKPETGIIVVDEPTSAMDPETEYQILNSIRTISNNKTAIIVSHNLSCSTYVDKIIHLKDGKIIEMGSHKQLIEENGEYARLFELQAEKYTINLE